MSMLDDVKLRLRISHNHIDDDIASTIASARAELVRVGVDADVLNEDDELVKRYILTFCLAEFSADQKVRDGYAESWKYQAENLRRSLAYSSNGGVVDV